MYDLHKEMNNNQFSSDTVNIDPRVTHKRNPERLIWFVTKSKIQI
jgi:hypothetical protein